ncbi:gamma-glutamyl-gamma-aminobutyrate hydrolase family protein [Paenibacillus mendelii]|uniref:Gamma-glutamyl-gamma-aminobutyrate hydrolase family protein n=1 Tax=Paenibacillus mendelii TaxID=206163 RepID=A0ABV6JAX1_9BACL|nr:gamma-glutamyl-gamma-aminobutyrate hydrolase family protein [Paenibacillus mendelii]MCQ6562927.1 gamma-glutamyl-gamma-aminobutyrate hydrolase family protein [Paenibacillus mendelii]
MDAVEATVSMKKPVIGVTSSQEDGAVNSTECTMRAGGLPIIVPLGGEMPEISQYANLIDGLLLTGGADIDPSYFGEEPHRGLGRITPERDRLEIRLTQECLRLGKPIFAICRGIQVLNVAAGGALYQDIERQCEGLQHRQQAPATYLAHTVQVTPGSLLHRIAGAEEFRVNTFHHQAVSRTADGFTTVATAKDGIIEAIESVSHPFVLGVQWHPETSAQVDEISRKLFEAFIQACKESKAGEEE